MHETSGFRQRSWYQDPNHMTTTVKMKAHYCDRIWGRRKGQHHRRWENQAGLTTTEYSRRTWQYSMWLNGKIVVWRVFEEDLSSTSNKNHFRLVCRRRITTTMFKNTSTVAIPPSRVKWVSISSSLHRCTGSVEMCIHYSSIMVEEDVQVVSGRRTGCLWKTYSLIVWDVSVDFLSLFVHVYLCTRVGGCGNVYPYIIMKFSFIYVRGNS